MIPRFNPPLTRAEIALIIFGVIVALYAGVAFGRYLLGGAS